MVKGRIEETVTVLGHVGFKIQETLGRDLESTGRCDGDSFCKERVFYMDSWRDIRGDPFNIKILQSCGGSIC